MPYPPVLQSQEMWADMKKAARVLNSVVYDESASLAPLFQGYFVFLCVVDMFTGDGAAAADAKRHLQQTLYQSTTYDQWVAVAVHGGLNVAPRRRYDRRDVVQYLTKRWAKALWVDPVNIGLTFICVCAANIAQVALDATAIRYVCQGV